MHFSPDFSILLKENGSIQWFELLSYKLKQFSSYPKSNKIIKIFEK